MKNHKRFRAATRASAAALLLSALCLSVHADISTVFTSTNIAWPTEANPIFYSSTPLTGLTGDGPPAAAAGATASSLGETITITNLAGAADGSGPGSGTNYVLTGIGMVVSGYSSAAPVTLHIYDVTPNLSATSGSVYNGAGATYNFTTPTAAGDLLGENQGLQFYNDNQSGAEQVIYLGLQNGPNTYGDQVVLASNHTYAVEVSVPTSGQLFWFKTPTADAGGQGMGSANAAPNSPRTTLVALGQAGSAPQTFALALYGKPTTLLAPSVNGSTNIVATTNFWIDQFNALSVLPGNPYYTNDGNGTPVDYSTGNISSIWSEWFGDGLLVTWDNTNQAQGNIDGGLRGSMRIFDAAASGTGQIELWDGGNGITPALNGVALGFTSLECDVMFDASSAVQTNQAGLVYFGNLQLGGRTPTFGQDVYAGNDTQVPQTFSNQWVHVKIPIDPAADATTLGDIEDINIHIYEPYGAYPSSPSGNLTGNILFWIDNIKFKAPLATPLIPPPALAMTPATPGTARFWTTSPQYTRVDLATADTYQSWIGGPGDPGTLTGPYTKPVSYSFTLSHLTEDASAQTTLWLVDGVSGTYNGVDYTSGTELWLNIGANPPNGWTAAVAWKANDPGANPTNTALTVTNTVGVGTWTLTFTSETTGTLMAPGWQTASNFTIADPNVATDFANPLTAFIGIQGNGSVYGTYDDFTQISFVNMAGSNEVDVFANDSVLQTNTIWSESFDTGTSSGYYQITNATAGFTSAYSANVQAIFLVTTNTPFWATWNVTTNGYGLAESAGGQLPITSLVSPASLSGYTDVPLQCVAGRTNWALLPNDCLSAGKAFLDVVNPPPQQ